MEKSYRIERTNRQQVFSECANMMVRSDPWLTLGMSLEQCLKAFEGEFKEIHILEIGKELAGFVILQTQGTFKGYIQTIYIDKSFRGQGYGKMLLQYSEQSILKYSPNIFICVSSFNTGASKLYEEFGFKKVGELTDFLKKGYSEWLFRKTYGPIIGYDVHPGN